MTDRQSDVTTLRDLYQHDASGANLAAYLVANSRLPGPRANLALARAFADEVAASGLDDARWQLLRDWLAIDAGQAATGDPREFLPFCALQALGAHYANADDAQRREIARLLRAAAGDTRWRVREGVAIALQRIGMDEPAALIGLIDAWLPTATLLEQRAIIAGLAEPPLLRQTELARYALDIADRVVTDMQTVDPAARKTDEFRVLRQALEYALSVFIAAAPDDGLARLRIWETIADPDMQRVIRANLAKARLRRVMGLD